MAGSKISTAVTNTVLLGSASYGSPLTITGSGTVMPAAYSATGVLADKPHVWLANQGLVSGGAGAVYGSAGGIGVDLRSGNDVLSNKGTIAGGDASAVTGAGYSAGVGGNGVDISYGRAGNAGVITGGSGGVPAHAPGTSDDVGGNGGTGVLLEASSLSNSGSIIGGAGGYSIDVGGTGVVLGAGGSSLRNTGLIEGGLGGRAHSAPTGGIGASVEAGDTLVNAGMIIGGTGGGGGDDDGDGGTGLLLTGGRAVNFGTIEGGTGGSIAGYGGAGVTIDGGTLINYGTIQGGAAGPSGYMDYGGDGGSVQFGPLGGTLVMEPGSYVDYNIYDNSASNVVLRLAGTGGTLSFGNDIQFFPFTEIIVNADAEWTVDDNFNSLSADSDLKVLGRLTVGGGDELNGGYGYKTTANVFIGTSGTLTVLGTLSAMIIHFASGGGTLAIGNTAALTNPSLGVVGSTLTGFTSGDLIDVAQIATSLSFSGGTLTLEDGTSVVETLALAGDYSTANFHLAPDGHGGTDVTFVPDASERTRAGPMLPQEQAHSSVGLMAWFHGFAG